MRMRTLAVTALLLLPAGSLAAQQHQHGQAQPHAGGMHCGMMAGGAAPMQQGEGQQHAGMHTSGMMAGPPMPAAILQHRAHLELTPAQVSRLEAIQAAAQPACQQHMEVAMAAHHAAAQLLDAGTPDFAAFEAKLREAADHMIQGHVAMSRAAVDARAVLTSAQREKLKNLAQAHAR